MQDKEKIVSKIKKLMELATNNPEEKEKESAMRHAQRLMTIYNLEMTDLDSVESDYINDDTIDLLKSYRSETNWAGVIVQEHFFVKIVLNKTKNKIHVLGKPENVQVAKYIFEFLKQEFRRNWQNYKTEMNIQGTDGKTDYCKGLFLGLHAKLTEEKTATIQERGLVLRKDIKLDDFAENQFDKLKKSKPRQNGNDKIKMDGYEDGRKINIKRGLGDSGTNNKKLTSNA